MLRINLLPSYVSQRRLTRKLVIGFSALFILCLAIPLFLYVQASQQKARWEQEATAAEAGKSTTDGLRTQAQNTRSQIAPIQAKVDYVKAVHQHNNDIVTFWDTVSRYSDPKVIYSDAAVSGTTLTIKAYSPSLAEIGRYLQAMYQEPDFQSVGIDKLPGYPEAVVNKLYLGNQLLAYEASGGTSSGGGGGSFGGGQGPRAMGSAMSSSGSGGFSGGGGGFGGGNNSSSQKPAFGSSAEPGSSANGSQIPTVSAAQNGGSGQGASSQFDTQKLIQIIMNDRSVKDVVMNPFAPASSQITAAFSILKKIKVRREPQGFPVTVTAVLKNPLVVPQVPGTAGAATTGGAGVPSAFPGGPGGPGGPRPAAG